MKSMLEGKVVSIIDSHVLIRLSSAADNEIEFLFPLLFFHDSGIESVREGMTFYLEMLLDF